MRTLQQDELFAVTADFNGQRWCEMMITCIGVNMIY